MNKLELLMCKCKYSVDVSINSHKTEYAGVENFLYVEAGLPGTEWQNKNNADLTDELLNFIQVDTVTLSGMIANDSVVRIQFFPSSPTSCYVIYHYSLDKAIDECLALIGEGK